MTNRQTKQRVSVKSTLLYLAMALLIIAIVVIAIEARAIRQHIDLVGLWIEGIGPWGLLVFTGLYVLLTSLLFPEAVLSILAGSIFGIVEGLAVVIGGSLLAAALQFFLSHYFLRNRVHRAIAKRPKLVAIQRAVKRDAFHLQILLRLVPFNPATISYMLGATGVSFPGFLAVIFLLTPVLFVEVYFGHTGKHIIQMIGRGAGGNYLHDLLIIGGFLLCVAIVFVISRIARNAIRDAVEDTKDS